VKQQLNKEKNTSDNGEEDVMKSTTIHIKRGHAVTAQRGTIYDMRIHPNNRWICHIWA